MWNFISAIHRNYVPVEISLKRIFISKLIDKSCGGVHRCKYPYHSATLHLNVTASA
jgi:hypothetical protein